MRSIPAARAGNSGSIRRLVNRQTFEIALENPRGRSIDATLSMLDLFSFDVQGGSRLRVNLEELFHKYEVDVESHTRGLLAKLAARDADIKAEIIDLFAAKLLNFVRNPFCIEKVLNSFPGVASTSRSIPRCSRPTARSSQAGSRTKPIFAPSVASPTKHTLNGCACCSSC